MGEAILLGMWHGLIRAPVCPGLLCHKHVPYYGYLVIIDCISRPGIRLQCGLDNINECLNVSTEFMYWELIDNQDGVRVFLVLCVCV